MRVSGSEFGPGVRLFNLKYLRCRKRLAIKCAGFKAAPGHKVYPYLLRGVSITEPNHLAKKSLSTVNWPILV
jgi:hypothetical protein